MSLGDTIRVRILCCLTFLIKVKSKVSILRCMSPPPPPPLPPNLHPSSHSWGFLSILKYLKYHNQDI